MSVLDIPDWNGTVRRDGVRVEMISSTAAVIVHPDGTRIDGCLCCGKPVWTLAAAQRLADRLLPL